MCRSYSWILIIYLIFSLISCKENQENSGSVHPAVSDLSLKWKLVANDYQNKGVFKSILTLTNSGTTVLDNKNWELYFNHTLCRKILQDSIPPFVKIIHINGDFFKIVPTETFPLLNQNDSIAIPIVSSFAAIKFTDAPGGFYFIFKIESGKEGSPEIVENYTVEPFEKSEVKRSKNDKIPVPTATSLYQENLKVSLLTENNIPQIIPTPLSIDYSEGNFSLTSSSKIHYEKTLKREAEYLAKSLQEILKKKVSIAESNLKGKDVISLQKKNLSFHSSDEAYQLMVSQKDGVMIVGNNNAGVFYGIQSLRALIPIEAYEKNQNVISLPEVLVKDAPSFAYRGIMLDVARHFQPKESILKMLDVFSFYKINKLTLHLADDEGWRLQIQELPELTDISSKRGHTNTEEDRLIPAYGCGPKGDMSPANGHYSKADFIEILKYAKERHIEVIPEIDLPGHARAAIKAMDVRYKNLLAKGDTSGAKMYLLRDIDDQSVYSSVQLFNDNVVCPCQEGLYNFMNTVVKNVREMYSQADASLTTIHIGGDEVPEGVWEKSPACEKLINTSEDIKTVDDIKRYFLERTVQILNSQKIRMSAYEDIVIHRVKNEKGESRIEIREEFLPSDISLYSWSNVWGWGSEDYGYRLANKGFPVVLGHVTNLYFDLAYSKDPDEPGQYWGGLNDTRKAYEYTPLNIYHCAYYDVEGNPVSTDLLKDKVKLSDKGKSNIAGLQGLLFSETLKNTSMVEYFLFPKMIGMAERAWAKEPKWASIPDREKRLELLNRDWNTFANAIGQRELPRLDYINGGLHYRLPPPGAIIEDGFLKANSTFPGMTIRYTTDGSNPDATSEIYNKPVKVSGTVKVSTFNAKGRNGNVFTIVPTSETKN